MNVTRMSAVCFIAFGLLCPIAPIVAFASVGDDAIPAAQRAVACAGALLLWWAPFAYAMYLNFVVADKNDRGLLRRGIRGTAAVLSETRLTENRGEGSETIVWHKYHLEVSLPGRAAYRTYVRMRFRVDRRDQAVTVFASPRNRKRVTIDPIHDIMHRLEPSRPRPAQPHPPRRADDPDIQDAVPETEPVRKGRRRYRGR